MFGPLPLLHRIVLGGVGLCFGILAGVWTAHVTPLSVAISGGALAGGLAGLLAAYLLVHSPGAQPRPVRIHRHH